MLTLIVNNQEYRVDVAPDMPLLWALRDVIGLTGTKYSCGIGMCGSCTVHIDGEALRSCVVPVSDVVGRQIMTIEGLSSSNSFGVDQDDRHPIQQAWLDENVSQCGYCQPGQIMTAVSLLNQNPTPTDSDIDEAMSATLCRCGTYQRIRRAIHRAAGESA